MTRFSQAELDRLFDEILIDDVVDAHVALPDAIRMDYPDAQLRDGFAISHALWAAGFDRDATIALLGRLARAGAIDADDQRAFKHVRAKFKHLRFAFALYDRAHRCPPVFKAMTTSMGFLQDAFRGARRGATIAQAAVLRTLLTRVPLGLIEREIARVDLSDGANFRRFTRLQMDELGALLGPPMITGHHFHVARKIVSRQVSFHGDMLVIAPTDEHLVLSRYLSAINGLMGRFHDELVAQSVAGTLHYGRDAFAIPEDIRARISALLARYPA